jgi:hypothetical protein
MAGPRDLVAGPTFTTSPYGLWDAVQKPSASDSHWQNGITWVDRCPVGDTVYDECIAITGAGGSPTAQAAKAATFTQDWRGATSFAIFAEFDCSGVGLSPADVMSIADDALDRVEGWQVERAFWTGQAGKTATGGVAQTTVFPHLAEDTSMTDPNSTFTITLQTAAVTVTGGGPSQDIAVALGALEAQLADCYHGQGVIHIAPEVLPTMRAWKLVEKEGNALYTIKGNRVVVGDGYTGSSPANEAPAAGTSWIYATGALFGYRAEVPLIKEAVEGFDRIENTHKMIAERVYVIGFECCHLATLVDLGVPTT